jgi:hypothetical protein
MPPRHDIERYAYPGYHGYESACGLRIWQQERESVVMATELPDNPGTSITNRAEALAMQVYHEFELWPPFTRWIEHYPPDGPYDETFAEVTFSIDPQKGLTRPKWRALTCEDAERLIGEPLPDAPRTDLSAEPRTAIRGKGKAHGHRSRELFP